MTLLVEPRIAIRTPSDADVAGLAALVNLLAAESSHLFIMPIAGPDPAKTLRAHLAAVAKTGSEGVLVADCDGGIAGLLTAARGLHPAKRGVATVGIGVRPRNRRCGVGRALMTGLEAWAGEAGVDRLELTVVVSNAAAIALYRSCGYKQEGILRAAARIDGEPVDQIMMAKLL
ncbi:MAG TPA: GNAT family N-acetyltransferase [Stellaceae bacterium]|nr:GNAT family N-acetyltransferase [Stellaceae bacterium]